MAIELKALHPMREASATPLIVLVSVNQVIQLFNCVEVGDDFSVLVGDNRVQCWEEEHKAMLLTLGIPGMVIAVGFPVLAYVLM